jgi:uncharacterized coiled-coil protein SlyX
LAKRKEEEVIVDIDLANEATFSELTKALNVAAEVIAASNSSIAEVVREVQATAAANIAAIIPVLPDMRDIVVRADASILNAVTDLAIADVRRETLSESSHSQVEEGIVNQLSIIMSRLDKLENKPSEPNPKLESLKKQVAKHSKFLAKNKETIEDLTLWTKTGRIQWIRSLDKGKEGSHDGG